MKRLDKLNNAQLIQYVDNTIEMITEQDGLTGNEVLKFRDEIIKYGLFIEDKIPFVLIDLSVMQFDFALNVFNLLHNKSDDFFNEYAGRALLKIITPKTKLIVEREIYFKRHFTSLLRSSLFYQLQFFKDAQAVNYRLAEVEKRLSIKDMINNTEMYLSIKI